MDHNNFYAYETGTRSSSIQGWVETLGNPNGLNHTPTGLEDAPATFFRFDQDIDEALMFPATGPSDFLYDLGPVGNWPYIDNTIMPYPVPVLTDDTATTAYSESQAPSPASGTTLVDSPFAFSANVELARAGDVLVDQPVASPPSAVHNYAFTYQCGPTVMAPPFDPSPDLLQQTFCGSNLVYDQGQYWSGQQPSQHWVGAAGVVAPGLATGVEANANANAFTSMNPMLFSLLSAPFPEHQQEHMIPEQPRLITTTGENRAALDVKVEPTSSAGESNNEDATPPKKKRKQSTAKVFPCTFPGCTSGAYTISSHFAIYFKS